ncbi:hypothetical protein PG994_012810 [Apiospora phragmitis]|uniref:Cytochrome P450 n=1 Tax=Apiospora phragmitis TaxID=2905665 RepID=A0ABR1T6W0_9PEZI
MKPDLPTDLTWPHTSINNNAHRVGFWILAHLTHDPAYMEKVREEIDAAYLTQGPSAEPDMGLLLCDCPQLDAIWHETMWLYNTASAIRKATRACAVGGKRVSVGDQVMATFRQFHLNRELFGGDAGAFRPARFLDDKSLARRKGYAPFGGGHTYCPGRLFAQREIYLFVAETLRRFYLELVGGAEGTMMPGVDRNTPSAAAMGPERDVEVVLSVQKL